MSIRAFVPGDRDEEAAAAQGVAGILAGITLPSIEPFGSDNVALAGLPDCVLFPFPDPEPASRASVARLVIADGMASLAEYRVLENAMAASKAAMMDRILGALAVESAATGLSRYQSGMAETGCVAEIAAALCIPERTAAILVSHAVNLVEHPKTRAALGLGVLSWRHAVTILQELGTLAETPGIGAEDAACFEAKLLLLAQGCTASRFANKARKARESLFPDSLDARIKQAFRGRKISNEPGRDGMSWVELHIPTIAANAIMVHCTRAARAIKADALERQREAVASGSGEDCTEYRTLDQLRADIASILLMGQERPGNARYTTAAGHTQNTSPDSDAGTRNGNHTSDAGAQNSNHDSDAGARNNNRTGEGIRDHEGDDSGGGRSGGNSQSDSAAGEGHGAGFGGSGSTYGSAGDNGSTHTEHQSGSSNPDSHDDGAGSVVNTEGAGTAGPGVELDLDGQGQGVGFVPFGERSKFGVTLVDVEPPWAHALPDNGPRRDGNPQAELAGNTPDPGHQLTAGDIDGPSLPGILNPKALGSGAGGGGRGTAVPERRETPPRQDADGSGIPIEGIIVPFGTSPDGESTGAGEGTVATAGTAGMAGGFPIGGACASDTPTYGTPLGGPSTDGARDGTSAGTGRSPGAGTRHGAGAGAGAGGEVPVEGFLVGDGSGYADGAVDGIAEDSRLEADEQEAYLEQLIRLGGHPVLVDPPMPKALVLVKVPLLGLLGITDEPAELDDVTAGPVPLSIARKLLTGSSTFLRVLTDPVTGAALPLEPERYTLRDAERSVLQALAGGCYFLNCTNPVLDTELDHVQSFDSGGKSTMENLLPACRKHHGLKHFADDKDRKGNLRRWAEPWRTGLRLRGWTPRLCGDGRVGWVSPSGTYKAPDCIEPQRPAYPKWLKKRFDTALNTTGGFWSAGADAKGTQPTGANPADTNPVGPASTDTHADHAKDTRSDPADFASPLEHLITRYLQSHGKRNLG